MPSPKIRRQISIDDPDFILKRHEPTRHTISLKFKQNEVVYHFDIALEVPQLSSKKKGPMKAAFPTAYQALTFGLNSALLCSSLGFFQESDNKSTGDENEHH